MVGLQHIRTIFRYLGWSVWDFLMEAKAEAPEFISSCGMLKFTLLYQFHAVTRVSSEA